MLPGSEDSIESSEQRPETGRARPAPQEDLVLLPHVTSGAVLRGSCEGTQVCMALKLTVYISPFADEEAELQRQRADQGQRGT